LVGTPSQRSLARFGGYLGGTLAWGLLVYNLACLALLPPTGAFVPLALLIMGALSGLLLRRTGARLWPLTLAAFLFFTGSGLVVGHLGVAFPFVGAIVLGSLCGAGLRVALRTRNATKWALPFLCVALFFHGYVSGRTILEELSFPTAHSVGVCLLALCVFYACYRGGEARGRGEISGVARFAAWGAAVVAVIWRLSEYQSWYEELLAPEMALGFVRFPVLALAVFVVAIAVWMRQREGDPEPDDARRGPAWWLVMLCAAFFIVPHGTVRIRNPFFVPRAPEASEARHVMRAILSETYHAFNLDDESDVYDRLAENVAGELITQLFLDSRRSLEAGTRQGAVVTVKDVSIVEIGTPLTARDLDDGFAYECQWIVTARVQHWQHVHTRQNIYGGELRIRIEDDHWKLVGLELTSEERVVISRQA
jgi:hydrogenase/urease accessory protein HupE